jgi:hypothetical protein
MNDKTVQTDFDRSKHQNSAIDNKEVLRIKELQKVMDERNKEFIYKLDQKRI